MCVFAMLIALASGCNQSTGPNQGGVVIEGNPNNGNQGDSDNEYPEYPEGPEDPNGSKIPIVGIEAAKLLLAEQRLQAEALADNEDIFENGSAVMKDLAERAITNLGVTVPEDRFETVTVQLESGYAFPVVKLVDDIHSGSLGNEKQDIGKAEVVGDTVEWSDFGEVCNSYEYFLNLTNNIVISANIASDVIDYTKKNIRIVDKWVKMGEEYYYLRVKENEELLCRYDGYNKILDICRRYRNGEGLDVYELYRMLDGWEERMTYIPGIRYELSMNGTYFTADFSKGYWETYVVGDMESHYNVSYMIMKNDICFEVLYDAQLQEETLLKIISADKQADIVFLYGNGETYFMDLQLCAFDGVAKVTAPKEDAGFGEGFIYVANAENVKLYTTNGSIVSADTDYETDKKVRVMGVGIGSYVYGYDGVLHLAVSGEDPNEILQNLKDYLAEIGLTCRRDIDTVFGGIERAYVEIEGLIRYYKWNGIIVTTEESIGLAIKAEKERFAEMKSYCTALKNEEIIEMDSLGEGEIEVLVNFAPIVSSDISGATVNGLDLAVEKISLAIDDTTLIVKDEPYRVVLALADSKGSLVHVEQTGESATFYSGEGGFTATASDIHLTLPLLAAGEYLVVAYIATSDGIRSSGYIPVGFSSSLSTAIRLDDMLITTASNANGGLRVIYTQQVDIYLEISSAEKLDYAAFSALLSENAFQFGVPDMTSLEVLKDGTYTAMAGTETEIADGSYRLAYSLENGDIKQGGYVYVHYSQADRLVDVYLEITSAEKLDYAAFSVLLSENARQYGMPDTTSLEVLKDGIYTAMAGTETEITDGSYRLVYSLENGGVKQEGYIYIHYSQTENFPEQTK